VGLSSEEVALVVLDQGIKSWPHGCLKNVKPTHFVQSIQSRAISYSIRLRRFSMERFIYYQGRIFPVDAKPTSATLCNVKDRNQP
jgi:hypothetical protein